jgi:molybdenum cofactor cytidylyltransferase
MISAIVLAGGASQRMGRAKMVLPWGTTTVLGQVIGVLQSAGVQDILVVTGASRSEVEQLALAHHARIAFNAGHLQGEMLSSLQTGISHMSDVSQAALIALGDQPQIQGQIVRRVLLEYAESGVPLIVPSYQMRRGHPWLIGRQFWEEIRALRAPESAREFLSRHARDIRYIEARTPTVLQDMDTENDYLKWRP